LDPPETLELVELQEVQALRVLLERKERLVLLDLLVQRDSQGRKEQREIRVPLDRLVHKEHPVIPVIQGQPAILVHQGLVDHLDLMVLLEQLDQLGQ